MRSNGVYANVFHSWALAARPVRHTAKIGHKYPHGPCVSVAAVPYYERMIGAFDPRLAGRALRAFTAPIIYSVLRSVDRSRPVG